jgi:hypothetical protein
MKATLGGLLGKVPIPTPAMAVALLALFIAASGTGVAAISYTASDGTITACRDNRTGALRVIQSGQTCNISKETTITWNDGITGMVADSDKLDGKDSSEFYAQDSKVADSAHADQADSATSANSAADADTLDGADSSEFLSTDQRLTTDNIARAAGTITLDFGSIGAQSCSDRSVSAGTDLSNDVVAVTLGSNDLLPLSFYTAGSSSNSNAFRLVVCNLTATSYDPPSTTYRWVAFDQPACAECEQIAAWESAAQTDLRNAATAANACNAENGSYANCTTIAQLGPYGFSPTNGVVVNGINGNISNWSASMQHSSGGSAFTYATFGPNAGQVVRVPRGTGAPLLP